ncbi:MAG TPA: gliding motility protein GldL [Tenuifilaceae bacterium]|nr:gliding motility protein GldL [Tenuifilaceae bacterium]
MKINIEELVTSRKWKTFMKYLYGWGASVVILGALFKILHLPGAGTMLMAGMCTESIIFFFSAFEPLPDEFDWTLVFPELTGMTEEDEIDGYKSSRRQGIGAEEIHEIVTGILASMPAGSVPAAQAIAPEKVETTPPHQAAATAAPQISVQHAGAGAGGALIFTEKFNQMLENAEISPALFDKVSQGLNKLSQASSSIADITTTAVHVKEFTDNMARATESVKTFHENYSQNSQVLNESMNHLSDSIQKTAGEMSESGKNFMDGVAGSVQNLENELTAAGQKVGGRIVESCETVAGKLNMAAEGLANAYQQTAEGVAITYQQLAEAMKNNGSTITKGSTTYNQQLEQLNKNMAALNTVHEMHLQETTQRLKEAEKLYQGVDGMIKKLNVTVDESEKFKSALETLNSNITSLNNVYGNMLAAINSISTSK